MALRPPRASASRVRAPAPPPASAPLSFPAPTGGWTEARTLGAGRAARTCENMFPTTQGVRVRGGSTRSANIGAAVKSMFSYRGATSKLFAATTTAIYDITALDPVNVPAASQSGLTAWYWSTAQIATVGGEFLYAVNGSDAARLFNGTSWQTINGASTPSITGIATNFLSYVWVFKNRLWFVEASSRRAWYLPVDSIGGAAQSVSLDGVFQRGGSLLFGATWSADSGDGMDDRIVFVSSRGEVAVYEGSNPASAADWSIVGLYSMPAPRGPRCHVRAGGDILIGTDTGLVSLQSVVEKDASALETSAVTAPIETSWRANVIKGGLQPWEAVKLNAENMLLVTLPQGQKSCFVANIQTGALAKYTGWDTQCATVHDGKLYFGSSNGFVYAAETGGDDDGAAYVARLSLAPSDAGSPGVFKTAGAIQATFLAETEMTVQLSVVTDYLVEFPPSPTPTVPPASTAALWGTAIWGVSRWGDDGFTDGALRPVWATGWVSIGASGSVIAPQLQITVHGPGRPSIELLSFDVMIEGGTAMT